MNKFAKQNFLKLKIDKKHKFIIVYGNVLYRIIIKNVFGMTVKCNIAKSGKKSFFSFTAYYVLIHANGSRGNTRSGEIPC